MNNKKRYILTHPLTGNYGGLLQAYALYSTINALGYQAYIYRYQPEDMPLGIKDYWRHFKRHIKYCLGKCDEDAAFPMLHLSASMNGKEPQNVPVCFRNSRPYPCASRVECAFAAITCRQKP